MNLWSVTYTCVWERRLNPSVFVFPRQIVSNLMAQDTYLYMCSISRKYAKGSCFVGFGCGLERVDFTNRQTSNISHTLVGNKMVDRSDVVGASPVSYIFILDATPGFNGLGKDNCKTRRETFMFCDLVRLILEVLWHVFQGYVIGVAATIASVSEKQLWRIWINEWFLSTRNSK